MPYERKNLLSSQARIQVPFIAVTIGDFKFGVYSNAADKAQNAEGFYKLNTAQNIQYPNYIQSLHITKINGQINQYSLEISYPVKVGDDPNFFERVFSSVSGTRKITFSYGDWAMPSYIFKEEEAIITKIHTRFNFGGGGSFGSIISYTVEAVSAAQLGKAGCRSFLATHDKPSNIIKGLFNDADLGLYSLFTGMSAANLNMLIDGSDAAVDLADQLNVSALDYISYLVGCMIPEGTTESNISKDIYILTIHDDTTYDRAYADQDIQGAYFKVTRQSYDKEQADAYEIDIGYNTSTLVTNFALDQNENYSLLYNYEESIESDVYVRRLNDQGLWEDVYAPAISSKNSSYSTRPQDTVWWTKITQYPINATITVQGLLRPATLMQYIRLNVIFPDGNKHISSGLYIITKQVDEISGSGYRTTLSLTKVGG